MSGIGRLKVNARGFEVVEFRDEYGEACSLQQSSAADGAYVWLGYDKPPAAHPVTGEALSPRMHLDRRQVRGLMVRLQQWLETGSFKSPKAGR